VPFFDSDGSPARERPIRREPQVYPGPTNNADSRSTNLFIATIVRANDPERKRRFESMAEMADQFDRGAATKIAAAEGENLTAKKSKITSARKRGVYGRA